MQPPPTDPDFVPQSTEGLGLEEFVARHPYAVLVIRDEAEEEQAPEFLTLAGGPLPIPPTRKVDRSGSEPQGRERLLRVRKRGANPFAHMITIGRARNNDVWINTHDVSKFHAYLSEKAGGGWQLTDAGSTNGTAVAGQKLTARLAYDLPPGAVVTLGSAQLRLLQGPSLFRFLCNFQP